MRHWSRYCVNGALEIMYMNYANTKFEFVWSSLMDEAYALVTVV